ncbi:MAG: hypothetical protein JNL98_06870 [Bryobacterales bacterium]|nr:hypothetical protein [Bryobacterales bacterium]
MKNALREIAGAAVCAIPRAQRRLDEQWKRDACEWTKLPWCPVAPLPVPSRMILAETRLDLALRIHADRERTLRAAVANIGWLRRFQHSAMSDQKLILTVCPVASGPGGSV